MKYIVGFDFCGTLVSRQTLRLVVLNSLIPKEVIEILDKYKYTRYVLKLLERIFILFLPYYFFERSIERNTKLIASDFDFELFDSKKCKAIISASAKEIIAAVLNEVDRDCVIIAASLNASIFKRYEVFFKKPCRRKGKVFWWGEVFDSEEYKMTEFHTDSSEDDYIGALADRYYKIPTNDRF